MTNYDEWREAVDARCCEKGTQAKPVCDACRQESLALSAANAPQPGMEKLVEEAITKIEACRFRALDATERRVVLPILRDLVVAGRQKGAELEEAKKLLRERDVGCVYRHPPCARGVPRCFPCRVHLFLSRDTEPKGA